MPGKTYIFDLDGVIVDTAKYHFMAWKKLADGLNITLGHEDHEKLKGVSREKSLEIILEIGKRQLTKEEKEKLLEQKNLDYLSSVQHMNESEILPGVMKVLKYLKENHNPIVLGSASKNARSILEKVGLLSFFDVIVDGNRVTKAKPDPDIFLIGAEETHTLPENCVVFEDAIAGIQAANEAKMISVGIGDKTVLREADYVFMSFNEIPLGFFDKLNETIKEVN